MKASNILTAGMAAAALLAGCAQENDFVPERESEGDGAKVYSFTATAEDPMTRAFFKEEEAPSRFIYWDDDDEFDFHDIEIAEDGEKVSVSSSKPTSMGVSKKSVLFEKSAHDYMLITYPKGAVSLVDTVALNYVSSKQTDTLRFAPNTLVKVSVPKVQELSSVLTPDNLPMASFRMALSDKAKAAVKEGKDTVSADFQNPVKMYPLAGLVKMTITGLPEVASATVTKVNIMSEFDAKSYTGYPQRGLRGDNIICLKDTMAVVGNWTSGDTRFDVSLYGENTLPYTAEKGVDVCFVTNHSMAGMKTLQVVVYTSDGAVYKKTFDTGARQIGFSKSRITSFTLDFTNGSVIKAASEKFSVEWSKGYLVYDADNKAYKIGDKQDLGLYFKFGCPDAIALYESNKDWLDRIKPSNLVDQEIGGTGKTQEVTPDGQTLKNGTDFFYNGYEALAASWRDHACYTVSGSSVTESVMKSENEYLDWVGTTSFTGENDPCSLVKVAAGEKSWRLPTLDELKNLVEVGAPGVEFGNFDGSDIGSSDGKSRYVKYTDGEQEFYLMANGVATTKFAKGYSTIQLTYSSKYAVNFFCSDYVGTVEPQTSNSKNYSNLFTFSLSSTPTVKTGASLTSKASVNLKNNYSGTRTYWDAVNVRCVRDK